MQKSAPVKPSILPSAVPSLEDDSVITVEDEKLLLEQKGDILNLDPEKSDAAWDAWAKAVSDLSPHASVLTTGVQAPLCG